MVSKAQVMALTAGDSCLEKGANLLLFSPPGVLTLPGMRYGERPQVPESCTSAS
jgi:hypothetical protein